jgi:hypothetical protein
LPMRSGIVRAVAGIGADAAIIYRDQE